MKKHKFTCIFITVLVCLLLACGTALAAWNVSEYAINLLTMASYKSSIQENYIKPEHVDPGQKVVKEVHIKNEGNVPSFIRVKVRSVFGTFDAEGRFKENQELDPEMIQIHYNTDFWILCEDGYWYYKDVLGAGKTTRKPLMDSYYLSEKADNRYKNKEARILVNMESIQAESTELKNIWGKDAKKLGIISQPCICEIVTSVTFDKQHKLLIGGEKKDLFANFKNLQPGCKRSQTIRVTNSSDIPVKMYLRAELTKQKNYSPGKLEKLQKLLSEYAIIEIRENEKVLYQGSVDGKLTGQGWSMKKDISLGDFGAGVGKSLVVQLSLSEDMENTYEELLGKVKWIFTAAGDASELQEENEVSEDPGISGENDNSESQNHQTDGNTENNGTRQRTQTGEKIYATVSPKTGDSTQVVIKWFALFAAFTAIVLILRTLSGKEKNR